MFTQTKYNERWRKLKSFMMSSLRTHGFGTQKSEEQIHRQLECFTADLEARKGKPNANEELEDLFMKGTTSVLMKMVAGVNYDYDDPELLDLIDRIKSYQKMFFEDAAVIFVLVDVLPWWLIRIVRWSTFKRSITCASGIRKIIQGHIDVSSRKIIHFTYVCSKTLK